ncbi:chitin synthase-domain-containing protein [Blakeslea trispora]|nr:chitin synthase-domain-containing protein [Blakeslea trispora]
MPNQSEREAEAVTDLCDINDVNNEKIIRILRSRFTGYNVYTYIGTLGLISVNPFKRLAQNDAQTSEEYVALYRNASLVTISAKKLDPHIFGLVNRAFFHMRRTGKDQVVVLCGESGSGKTETSKLIIQHLLCLSNSKKQGKLHQAIQNVYQVLNAFGCARTGYNKQTGSRYGAYMEIHFNERGKLVGAKTLQYLLEKSRVSATSHRPNEGNFNIFYWLLAGTSPDEKQMLQLKESPKDYPYLAHYGRDLLEEDAQHYKDLKIAMRTVGLKKEHVSRIIQLLAAILHLGTLQFSSGVGEGLTINNPEILDTIAELLGLEPEALGSTLLFKTVMIGNDTTTLILDEAQAIVQRDKLAEVLYSLLFSWIVECINQKTYTDHFSSFFSLVDLPGTQATGLNAVGFEQFCINYASERIYHFVHTHSFNHQELALDDIELPTTEYPVNTQCVELFERPNHGIRMVVDDLYQRARRHRKDVTEELFLETIKQHNHQNSALSFRYSDTGARQFAVEHFSSKVFYDTTSFIANNRNESLVDFVTLFRGTHESPGSWNSLMLSLFSDENLSIDQNPIDPSPDWMSTQQSFKPVRQPSVKRSDIKNETDGKEKSSSAPKTVLSQVGSSIDDLLDSFQDKTLWSVFCIRPNLNGDPTQFDKTQVESQISALNLASFAERSSPFFIESLTHSEFLSLYRPLFNKHNIDESQTEQDQCKAIKILENCSDADMSIGSTKVFLSYPIWSKLEEELRTLEKMEQKSKKLSGSYIGPLEDQNETDGTPIRSGTPLDPSALLSMTSVLGPEGQNIQYASPNDSPQNHFMSTDSFLNSQYAESRFGESDNGFSLNKEEALRKSLVKDNEEAFEKDSNTTTAGRKQWLWFVWALTFWIPDFCLIKCGRMKRKDVRVAWREKVALCSLIVLSCAFVIWFLVFFADLICPHQNLFSESELASYNSDTDGYASIRGEVFKLSDFASHHYPGVVSIGSVLEYVGKDVTDLFPVQVSDLCEGASPYVSLDYTHAFPDNNSQYHDFRYHTGDYRPNWYYDQLTMLRNNYKVGNMGYDMKGIKDQASGAYKFNGQSMNRNWAIIDGHVYDLTPYIIGGRYTSAPLNEALPSNISTDFLNTNVVNLFWQNSGMDITSKFNNLTLTDSEKQRELTRMPEESDKFVICQVTCYTEDEQSLKKTIDSLACLRYDDKRKLILVICDGMIVGSGNDRPTPRIVLDILGVNPTVDPKPLSFISVGEGSKKHNRAKLYSGLYEIKGHVVPFLVVVKVGAPNERQKPGNRGKRDSQLILMGFLNRVQFDAPMNPMQLEMYHQMKNVIGISPEMYDYVLMVDADTEVMPMGMSYLVSSMAHDSKIIGLCGETTLSNEKDTWVTMIQVYEYFISHHMIKSFESLFSTVSCLPGCFTMYRIRTVDGKRPLFVSNEIIEDYSINVVDTLHKKNLLYLGEDRYLTTLLLKHFPSYKTKFNADAQCKTNAPDTWSVLVSQRRRWINSTVHNLGELAFLNQLCGFCCFSMRFVVILDLISTIVQPALLAYLGVLIWKLTTATNGVPYITIITLSCTYGLQIFVFILHKRWEYIVWFLISILALPVFSFYIPLYSYWHFDDFSWGNTRIVVGEKGKKKTVQDEGEFDPRSIPLMRWSEHEPLRLAEDAYSERMSQHDDQPSVKSNRMTPMYSSTSMIYPGYFMGYPYFSTGYLNSYPYYMNTTRSLSGYSMNGQPISPTMMMYHSNRTSYNQPPNKSNDTINESISVSMTKSQRS